MRDRVTRRAARARHQSPFEAGHALLTTVEDAAARAATSEVPEGEQRARRAARIEGAVRGAAAARTGARGCFFFTPRCRSRHRSRSMSPSRTIPAAPFRAPQAARAGRGILVDGLVACADGPAQAWPMRENLPARWRRSSRRERRATPRCASDPRPAPALGGHSPAGSRGRRSGRVPPPTPPSAPRMERSQLPMFLKWRHRGRNADCAS